MYNLGVTLCLKLWKFHTSHKQTSTAQENQTSYQSRWQIIHLVCIKCCAHERYRKDGNIMQFYPARNQSCYYTAVFQGLLHSIAYPPISSPYWASQQYESLLNNNAFTLHTSFAAWNTPYCFLKREAAWRFIRNRAVDVQEAAPACPSWADELHEQHHSPLILQLFLRQGMTLYFKSCHF